MTEIKSVLVTGGSGFLGKALARFLLRNGMAERICLFSRGEYPQAVARAELGNDPRLRFFVGDVRDLDRLAHAMEGADLVIHAAALKRIEVGRYNPYEMVQTNVTGTLNIVSASRRAGVAKVVAISSDKACLPKFGSAYGQTKALMETIILAGNDTGAVGSTRYSVCRYGNVWGSTGSVLPRWIEMIRRGVKTVPVTDPEATRFYMTIDEAVQLVISTAAHMKGGELAIPELPAYRVGDLVEALGVGAEVIGLPSWEKLDEEMREGYPSNRARRLTVEFLRGAIAEFEGARR